MRPSFISSSISGIIIFVSLIMYVLNINKIKDIYSHIIILLLLGIGFGIHSLCHYKEEINYDYNPLIGRWKIRDLPV